MNVCPMCSNRDARYFYVGSRGEYCRKCVMFISGIETESGKLDWDCGDEQYLLDYPLTKHQLAVSLFIRENVSLSDVLVDAVCGAGMLSQ